MSDFSTERLRMVDGQIRPSDVTDLRIIEAMLAIPREVFVPSHLRAVAYLDQEIAVGSAQAKRGLLKPVVLAKLLQAASVSSSDRVLIVGCASGYSAAVASRLAAQVVATESDQALFEMARSGLKQIGASNVTLSSANPIDGAASSGPYDVILVDGASEIPLDPLYGQLKDGGRLVAVSAMSAPARAVMVTRSGSDYGNRVLFDASAWILPGLARVPAFAF